MELEPKLGTGWSWESSWLTDPDDVCALCAKPLNGKGWAAEYVDGHNSPLPYDRYPIQHFCSKECLEKAQQGAELWTFTDL